MPERDDAELKDPSDEGLLRNSDRDSGSGSDLYSVIFEDGTLAFHTSGGLFSSVEIASAV